MIVSLTLGIVMAVIVGIAVTATIYFLLRKIKAGQKTGVIVGLILGVVAGVMMVMMAGRVVIVQGEEDYGTFLVYGTPSYEFSNGLTLNLDMGSNETYIRKERIYIFFKRQKVYYYCCRLFVVSRLLEIIHNIFNV